jgi:hypothetical protein
VIFKSSGTVLQNQIIMRRIHFTQVLFVSFAILILGSCSSTNTLTLSVTEPALVYLPSEIKTAGIINRSLPSEKNAELDQFQKVLTIEGKNLDRDGARVSITGLHDELLNNKLFSEVRIIDNINAMSPGLGIFPAALSWNIIDQICYEKNVDAIYELSSFDTDTKIDYQAVQVQMDGPLGIKIPAIEHRATVTTFIKTGWRIYDPVNKIVQDEFFADKQVVIRGAGINPMRALEAVKRRNESVLQMSNTIGRDYAIRILPYRIRVTREYYVKGTNNFETAKRKAQTGDWDGAAVLWEKEVPNPDGKVAGRACYNMAIINEINGDLNAAIDWASKSYVDYNDKEALEYLNLLRSRIAKNEQLVQQQE